MATAKCTNDGREGLGKELSLHAWFLSGSVLFCFLILFDGLFFLLSLPFSSFINRSIKLSVARKGKVF